MNFNTTVKGVIVIEGHVQGLANTRALGEAGIPVIVISEHNCLAHYSRYCKKFYQCPKYISEEFIEFIIHLAIKENIRGWVLLPSNDHAVYNISAHLYRLKEYFKIISPKPEILEKIYNKELLIKLCQSIEVPVPLSWFPAIPEDINPLEYKFPLLIKGKNGLSFYKSSGKKAFLVETPDSLSFVVDTIMEKAPFSNLYFQNLLPLKNNKTVSFTAFSVSGEIKSYWMGVKIREHPVHFGTATFSRSINHPVLIPLAEKLLKKLEFTGVCEIEFLLDPGDNEFKLIEINARTWLWVGMAINNGINYPLMIYNFLNGTDMEYPQKYKTEEEWMHYITDIPFSLFGILKGHYSIREIFNSYLKFPRPAVFKLSDILPTLAEIVLLPFLIFKR